MLHHKSRSACGEIIHVDERSWSKVEPFLDQFGKGALLFHKHLYLKPGW